jgi:hypothetical protein
MYKNLLAKNQKTKFNQNNQITYEEKLHYFILFCLLSMKNAV